jgi:hypothetical protein
MPSSGAAILDFEGALAATGGPPASGSVFATCSPSIQSHAVRDVVLDEGRDHEAYVS